MHRGSVEQGHWEKVLEEGTGREKNVQSAGNGLSAVESWRPLGQSKAFFSWLLSCCCVKTSSAGSRVGGGTVLHDPRPPALVWTPASQFWLPLPLPVRGEQGAD